MTATKFHVGQTVRHVPLRDGHRGRGPETYGEFVVTKVARVWASADPVDGGIPLRFRVDSGMVDAGQGWVPNSRVVTPEILADEQQRADALAAIEELSGLVPRMHSIGTLAAVPTDTLAQIVHILRDAR